MTALIKEQEKQDFSYRVIANLIAVLGESASPEDIFSYLSDYHKFEMLAVSSSSANLQFICDNGRAYFEQRIVIPVPKATI